VVVDYTAALVEPLRAWLRELAQHPGHANRPLRLLLLEREAGANNGWLQSLARGGHSEARLPELFDPLEPKRLDPLESPEHRRKVLAEMLASPHDSPVEFGLSLQSPADVSLTLWH